MKRIAWITCLALCPLATLATTPSPTMTLPGRLFYTPAQRAMLNDARVHKLTDQPNMSATAPAVSAPAPAPVSFDGVITRSDGVATHWVNGRPQVGHSSDKVQDLKPGQTRAAQKVYESYQIRQPEPVRITPPVAAPTPAKPARTEEPAP